MSARVAFLLDGGFVRVKLEGALGRFPAPTDVLALTERIRRHERLSRHERFRIYWYDAPPLGGSETNPLNRRPCDFGSHPVHARNQALQDGLARAADVALRRGETVFQGWKPRNRVLKEFQNTSRPLTAADLAPNIEQKGVDLRIGLDVASLAVKRIVEIIVLVSGDSDLVPAMEFARREGLKVCLDTLGDGQDLG